MTFEDITDELRKVRGELVDFIETTPDELLTERNDGHWSIIDVLDHLLLSEQRFATVLDRLVRKADVTAGSGHGGAIPVRLDAIEFPTNFEGVPAFTGTEPRPNRELTTTMAELAEIRARTEQILELAREGNLENAVFPHPYFGKLNFYEWVLLIARHEKAHLEQARKSSPAPEEWP